MLASGASGASGAFGATMARYFGANRVPMCTRSLHFESGVAMTHLRCDTSDTGMTAGIPRERALVVAVQLQPLASHELWIAGRSRTMSPYARGACSAVDLDSEPVAVLDVPYDTLQFYLPQRALNAFAEAEGGPVMTELSMPDGVVDPVLEQIARLSLYLTAHPDEATPALQDGLMLALYARLTDRYAGSSRSPAPGRGGLAPWQERRVKELIEARLGSPLGLAQMAAECGLSPSHFARAFKHTTGAPPYRWLQHRRVARAQQLLLTSQLMLSEIAILCGYADQSHLCKAFRAMIGSSPAAWRRDRVEGQ